jgi:hypothetical protein
MLLFSSGCEGKTWGISDTDFETVILPREGIERRGIKGEAKIEGKARE